MTSTMQTMTAAITDARRLGNEHGNRFENRFEDLQYLVFENVPGLDTAVEPLINTTALEDFWTDVADAYRAAWQAWSDAEQEIASALHTVAVAAGHPLDHDGLAAAIMDRLRSRDRDMQRLAALAAGALQTGPAFDRAVFLTSPAEQLAPLTLADAGRLLGISRQGAHDLVARGKLDRIDDAGERIVDARSVQTRLRNQLLGG